MRTFCILLALAWSGSAVAASSPDSYIAQMRETEAKAIAKTPDLVKRDGDVLTFFSKGKPVARLTYRWQPNKDGAPLDYSFRGAVRLKEPGDSKATPLAVVDPNGVEVSESIIVDSRGRGWYFMDSNGEPSPDGRYVTSIVDFGFRRGDPFIVDWSDPQKPTQIVALCTESRWLSAIEIVGACAPLVQRKGITYVRMHIKAQPDGRWLMIEERPLRQIVTPGKMSFVPVTDASFKPTSRLSTPGPALARMGPPLETLSGQ